MSEFYNCFTDSAFRETEMPPYIADYQPEKIIMVSLDLKLQKIYHMSGRTSPTGELFHCWEIEPLVNTFWPDLLAFFNTYKSGHRLEFPYDFQINTTVANPVEFQQSLDAQARYKLECAKDQITESLRPVALISHLHTASDNHLNVAKF